MKTNQILRIATTALAIMFTASLVLNVIQITDETDPICPDYSNAPINTLSVSLIHDMVDVYQQKHLIGIERELGNTATRNIVFDLPTLKRFIYQVEQETQQQAAANNMQIDEEDLGIRIYYCAYPEDSTKWDQDLYNGNLDDLMITNTNYAQQHTLVMVPTINMEGGKPADFNPLDIETYQNGILGVKGQTTKAGYNYFPNSTSTTMGLGVFQNRSSGSASSTVSQNHGSLYPPKSGNNTLAAFD